MGELDSIDMVHLATSWVSTETGEKMRLGQVWKNNTAVLIFLRHFACIACRAHAKQIWDSRSRFEGSNGKVIFIGNGQPSFIEAFKKDLGLEDSLIVTDPTLQIFRAAGFKKGFFYVVHPGSVVNAIKLVADGHKQTAYTKEAGTHWQLGGVMVINPQAKVLYHFTSETLGDFPEIDDILQFESDATLNS